MITPVNMGSPMMNAYPVTMILIGITVAASWWVMDKPAQKYRFMLSPNAVVHGKQAYRVLTHGFIHRDWMHLLINMYVFYVFGQTVEFNFLAMALANGQGMWTGRGLMLLLYFGAIVVASLPALIKRKDDPNYFSLGASGATSAVVMAFVLVHPESQLLLFFIIPIPAVLAAVLFFVYEYAMHKKGGTGVAHDAHLGGAIFGVAFMLLLEPQLAGHFFNQLKTLLGMGA